MTTIKKFFVLSTVVFSFSAVHAFEGKLTCKKLVSEGLTLPDSNLSDFCTPAYTSCLEVGALKKVIAAVQKGQSDVTTRSVSELQSALSSAKSENHKSLVTCEIFLNSVVASQKGDGGSSDLKDIAGYGQGYAQ